MKIGIVGYGSIGTRHAANAQGLGHEVIVYDPQTRRDVKFERQIYDDCDAVVIATPSLYHESGLRACIERRKPVLVEKPISKQIGMLPILLDKAREVGVPVMMGNNLRFHPCVMATKDAKLGQPIWATFVCATRSVKPTYLDDGVIFNTGAHEVDMAMHLLGPVARVLCATKNAAGTMADFVLLHRNECRSNFHLDFETDDELRDVYINGSDMSVAFDMPGRFGAAQFNNGASTSYSFGGSYADDYIAEMEAFIALAHGEPSPIAATGDDGLAALEVLLEVDKLAGVA